MGGKLDEKQKLCYSYIVKRILNECEMEIHVLSIFIFLNTGYAGNLGDSPDVF